MKKLIFIISLLIALTASAQSNGNTQAWIKATIENYINKNAYNLLNVNFTEDAKDISIMEMDGSTISYSEMPLKNINQVFIKESASGYTLSLLCSYDKACCETGTYRPNANGSAIKVPSTEPDKTGINIFMSASLKDDDMNIRLKKALVHLITLNGGKVLSDTF